MKNRAVEDRRQQKITVKNNRRKNLRRKEDITNISSYYFMLGLLGFILLFIIYISFVWG